MSLTPSAEEFRRRIEALTVRLESDGPGRALRDDAHQLKGSALVFGLDGLAVAAAAVEAACEPCGGDRAGAERAIALAAQLLARDSEALAERVVHDVRGELGVVLGHIEVLRHDGIDGFGRSQFESLAQIEAAVTRIASLVGPIGVDGDSRKTPPARVGPATPVVVVIEDDVETMALLKTRLGHLGATARGAADGETGLRLARELLPDLVMLDLGLPDLDGKELLRELRAEGHRVVVSSGDAGDGLERELCELGAMAVLPKPVDESALAGALALAAAHPA